MVQSPGREELGEGEVECWDGCGGISEACVQGFTQLVRDIPSLSTCLQALGKVGPASQVSSGKQSGRGELLGQLPQQHHPGNLIPEPPAKMPSALPTT